MAEFKGETFDAPEAFNWRAATRFAWSCTHDDGLDQLAAVEGLLRQLVRPEDEGRFEALCDVENPTDVDLTRFVMAQLAELSARPTERPSDSSDGPAADSTSSSDTASASAFSHPVVARLETTGRPDLALVAALGIEAQGTPQSA